VKLVAVLLWQFEHCALTGMCGGVVLPVAIVPLWQLEQLVSDDLC
jgi:sulfite exporter TauE/SafE